MTFTTHVVPRGDLIEHDCTVDCVCGPAIEILSWEADIASGVGQVVVHHSLDGREASE